MRKQAIKAGTSGRANAVKEERKKLMADDEERKKKETKKENSSRTSCSISAIFCMVVMVAQMFERGAVRGALSEWEEGGGRGNE